MKANAPEKIYIQPNAHDGWFERNNLTESLIEYTRTDAFIDKACLYLFENYHGEKLSLRMIENFKKYMKGE